MNASRDDLIRRGDVIDLCHKAIQHERAKSRHEYSSEYEDALLDLLDALTGWCGTDAIPTVTEGSA